MKKFQIFAFFALLIIPATFSNAQTPCGTITGPENIFVLGPSSPIVTVPITDCNNVFNDNQDGMGQYALTIDDELVNEDAVIEVQAGGTRDYSLEPPSSGYFYRHDSSNYFYVDTELSTPTEAEYRSFAEAHFSEGTNVTPYVAAALADNDVSAFTEEEEERYWNYIDYVHSVYVPIRPLLTVGTYTLVIEEPIFSQNTNSWLQQLKQLLVPTAYAQYPNPVYTLTFTITEAEPEPQGASSVLFLPGIQASRLYAGENIDDIAVGEKLWEPGDNGDVFALSMNPNGVSEHEVRTNDVIDEISGFPFGSNIYKGFMAFLDELADGENAVIADWEPFAYDWRYDVFDVVENGTKYLDGSIKYPTDELEKLAANSLSGKVTIIAHSNGGLLAKAMMIKLEEEGKTHLVDKIIFVGTPHLGTPKGIAALLHGHDQEALRGLIIDDGVARSVIRNMPGVYNLLPSEQYLAENETPIITFDDSSSTKKFRDKYGFAVTNVTEYKDFLNGLEDFVARGAVPVTDTSSPITANTSLLNNALENHRSNLDTWTAPSGVDVYNIIGTGEKTINALEYREVTESVCPINAVSRLLCPVKTILKPYAHFTVYGDGTVANFSNQELSGQNIELFFNLERANADSLPVIGITYDHANLTENVEFQNLIERLIGTNPIIDTEYFSTDSIIYDKNYEILAIDSPVQIFVVDSFGNRTGLVEENGQLIRRMDIPGSLYLEFGNTKYLIVPSTINYLTKLIGEAHGGYTMTIATLDESDVQTVNHMVVNATSTPNMVATFSKTNGLYGNIETDLDGNGTIEYQMSVDGELMVKQITYETLIEAIDNLQIKPLYKKLLFANAKVALEYNIKAKTKAKYEQLEELALKVLQQQVLLYKKSKILSMADADYLIKIINDLLE